MTYELNHPAFEPGRSGLRWTITEMFSGSRTRNRPPTNDRHLPAVGKPAAARPRPIPAQPPEPDTVAGGVAVSDDTTTAVPTVEQTEVATVVHQSAQSTHRGDSSSSRNRYLARA